MPREELISLVVAWLPLVVLLAVWFLLMRRANRHYFQHVAEVNGVNAQILEINREMLAELRDIRTALAEKRAP